MSNFDSLLVIIPTFGPPAKIITICSELQENGLENVLVVDDGSAVEFRSIFNSLIEKNVAVLHLQKNIGKGGALKAGMKYALDKYKGIQYVAFCDDDGQHDVSDVINLAKAGIKSKYEFIIGYRNFSEMPLKSFIGNYVMKKIMRLLFNIDLPDTQSGLRVMSINVVDEILKVPGDKFEFEILSLIHLGHKNIPIKSFGIKTIYFEKNKKTRFLALNDSVLVVGSILKIFIYKLLSK